MKYLALPYYASGTWRDVDESQLRAWAEAYIFSNTPLQPVLVTDGSISPPEWWSWDVLELDTSTWPITTHPAQLCDLLVTAAAGELGPCIAIDLDMLVLRSLAQLTQIATPLAMSLDFAEEDSARRWPPGSILKRNAGCMVIRDVSMFERLCDRWSRPEVAHYFQDERARSFVSELLLSWIHADLGGVVLPRRYNVRWDDPAAWTSGTTRCVHFVGDGKSHMVDFARGVLAGQGVR